MVDLNIHFKAILNFVGNAKQGLTKSVFLFVSQLTPMVNVDLLIANDKGQTLLTWREDELYGPGWHVPGGIIRFKESARDRIHAVAAFELDATVVAEDEPLCVREVMAAHRDVRGHFISLLYRCELKGDLDALKQYRTGEILRDGDWAWHDQCPENIITQHEMYRQFIKGKDA